MYRSEYNVCCQIDGRVVAALQTLPYPMLYHGREVDTAYISGVAVTESYRGQDIGNNLMRQAHFRLYYKDTVFATLIPAEEWLYGWYGKCGYAGVITCKPARPIRDMLLSPSLTACSAPRTACCCMTRPVTA